MYPLSYFPQGGKDCSLAEEKKGHELKLCKKSESITAFPCGGRLGSGKKNPGITSFIFMRQGRG
jgi:hypothetical protein